MQVDARTELASAGNTPSTTRRQLLQISLGVAANLAAILAGASPPAVHAQRREISLLSTTQFLPASNTKLDQLAQRFTQETGINVRIDRIANPQLPARLAAEAQMQAGHDLIELRMHQPIYYEQQLADLTDVVEPLAEQNGGMYAFCAEAALVKGRWRAMPWHHRSFPGSYNKLYFDQVDEPPPDTWDDLLRAGRQLKASSHPIGFAICETYDAISTLSAIMWCFGAKTVETDGKTVVINSEETRAAIEYVKQLYTDAMEPDVLMWDDNSNNRLLISGKGAWIHNAHSHYLMAKAKNMPIVEQIYFHLSPRGPVGRHTPTVIRSLGIWKFANHLEEAKEFIKFHFSAEAYSEFIMASECFNAPVYRSMENHLAWQTDPRYEPIKESGKYGHLYGWPAPGELYSQQVTYSFVIPKMFAKAVTGASTREAIVWAEGEIKRIYAS